MAPITMRTNEAISSLTNMILSTQVFANNIANTFSDLVDMAKVDVGLYGDQKRYIETDAGKSVPWTGDSEAANLLALNRPAAPLEETIILDVFRMIWVTTDNYLSKRAFADEGSFQSFNSVVLGWLFDTKRLHEATTYNTFIGTTTSSTGSQSQTVTLAVAPGTDTNVDQEARNRIDALTIASKVAEIVFNIKDATRSYNDAGFLRSYDSSDLIIVWSSDYANKIRYVDLPTVYHKDGLFDFKYVLPAKFFGTVNTTSKTTSDSNTRTLVECDISSNHYFPGDAIPSGTTLVSGGAIVLPTYQVNSKVICKIMHKDAVPFLTSFTANTEFLNSRSLTKNNYLIFGYNTLKRISDKPFVTLATT